MKTKPTNLQIRVMAINALYSNAKLILAYELEQANKLIGLDCFKVDGSLKAKYDYPKMETFRGKLGDNWLNVDYWREKSTRDFGIRVKICINGGSYDVKPTTAFCQYQEQSFSLLDIKEGILTPSEYPQDRTYLDEVFNANDLETTAKKVKEAAKVYEQSVETIPYLFRDVLNIERLGR